MTYAFTSASIVFLVLYVMEFLWHRGINKGRPSSYKQSRITRQDWIRIIVITVFSFFINWLVYEHASWRQ